MATLTVSSRFSARHGTKQTRTSMFVVEVTVNGPLADDFVCGIDDATLRDRLTREVANLADTLLDDIVGRATCENVAAYLLAMMRDCHVASVGVTLGDTRARVSEADVAFDKFDAELAFKRGVSLLLRDRTEEAADAFQEAIRLAPDSSRAHVARGRALRKLGRLQEALGAFDASIQVAPSRSEGHRNRANALLELGRTREALHAFATAVELGPDTALLLNNRGYALAQSGLLEEALADHDRAIELDPWYEEAFRDRAAVRARLGMTDLAAVDLARADEVRSSSDKVELERSKLLGWTTPPKPIAPRGGRSR